MQWLSWEELGLEGEQAPEWNNYIGALQNSIVLPIEQYD
jgi:hypothetical protein